jgi:hypothetical protein
MKAYVITTGTVFALLVAAHIWRFVVEGPDLAKNPAYVLTTLAGVSLCVWACYLLMRRSRS